MSRIFRLAFLVVLAGVYSVALNATFASAAADQNQIREVIVVFKTHFDIGYTDMASNVVHRYRTDMIDNALKCVDDSRDLPPEQQFVWTIPGWPMYQILRDWPGQSAERKSRVIRALKDGRFAVHALPFTTHTELLEPEDLVHGLEYSSRVCRELGLALPRDAKMTDVPCHSWFVPTLLKHAGVEFLHLGCNPGSRSPDVPRLFWWEGPDRSRVLTMYSAESYGTGLKPPSGWPYRTWLALIQTGDNHGPPRPDEVRALLDAARKDLPGVKVRIGRMSDFADALLAEKPEIPVVRADMPDSWIHGPLCDPSGAKTARNIRPAISSAQALQTHLQMLGIGSGQNTDLRAAFEQSLLYGEHTWGGALGWAVKYSPKTEFPYGDEWVKERKAGRFARLENSWAEHSAYIARSEALAKPVLEGAMDALATQVAVDSERVVVYNPLAWARGGVVRVKGGSLGHIKALQPADGGARVPTSFDGQWLEFVAAEIPAMGHRTFVPAKGTSLDRLVRAEPASAVLENRYLKAAIDAQAGALKSLVDRKSGRELIDKTGSDGFGQVLYERFDAAQVAAYVKAYVKIDADWAVTELGKPGLPPPTAVPYQASRPGACSLSFETNLVSVTAVMHTPARDGLPCAVTTRAVLYAAQPYLDLEITLEGKPADPWPEAGWISLPVAVKGTPQFRLMRQFSLMDPARDIVSGANRFLFGVHGGAMITGASNEGLAFVPLDSPLVSFDRPGCWLYAMEFSPSRPVGYVNLFNNQWSTNFRLWNEGKWTSRVRVWVVDRRDGQEAFVRRSLEARHPLLGAWAPNGSRRVPLTTDGIHLSRGGIMISAFGANPNGPGALVRLWEVTGRAGAVTMELPEKLKVASVQPVDLRGTPRGSSILVRDGKVRLQVDAFAPVSLVFGTAAQ